MRRPWLLACAVTALAAAPAWAGSVGPDSFGYAATDVAYSFIDLSTSPTAGQRHVLFSDDFPVTVDMGFNFSFYGADYTQVSWSPNGLVTFGGTSSEYDNLDLSGAALVDDLPSIAVFWDDLQYFTTGADRSYFETFGSSGNQYFVIQWNDVVPYNNNTGTSSAGTFQVILFESTGLIVMQYADLDFGDANYDYGASATVGIRDTGGQSNGYNLVWSHDGAALSDGQAIAFGVGITPEPGTMALFGLGAVGLGAFVARRRRLARRPRGA